MYVCIYTAQRSRCSVNAYACRCIEYEDIFLLFSEMSIFFLVFFLSFFPIFFWKGGHRLLLGAEEVKISRWERSCCCVYCSVWSYIGRHCIVLYICYAVWSCFAMCVVCAVLYWCCLCWKIWIISIYLSIYL